MSSSTSGGLGDSVHAATPAVAWASAVIEDQKVKEQVVFLVGRVRTKGLKLRGLNVLEALGVE